MRFILLAIICLLCWNSVLSQQKLLKAVQQETDAKASGKLARKLKDWKIFKLEGLGEGMPASTKELVFQWDKNTIAFKGQQKALTDEGSKIIELGAGYRKEHSFPKLVYFNGKGVRMTIGRNFILGEYTEKGKKIIIEQLGNFIPGADKKQVVVYAAADLINEFPTACGAEGKFPAKNHEAGERSIIPETKQYRPAANCRTVDIAVMANSTSYAEHGSSVDETAAYIASIYNLSEGDYVNAFSQEYRFKINELVVSTSEKTDPWLHTNDINRNLENFWYWALNEFRTPHDLSSYWFTTDNFSGGVIGLAHLGFTCNTVGDAVIREFKGSAQTMRCLLSHEIGHNFNLVHDAAGAPYIMAPSINGTKEFSETSKTIFEAFVSSGAAACITDCNFDACERTLINGFQAAYHEVTDAIRLDWSKFPGSHGYSIRWWERGSGQLQSANVDSNTNTFIIPLTCSNNVLYRVEVANICSNGQAGTYTGVEIANSNIPQISLDGPDIICAGATTLLRSSLDNGNQWYRNGMLIPGATGKTLTVAESGTYTVTVNREAGCSYTSNEILITQNSTALKPIISASGNTTFCNGSSVTLTSSSAIAYQWLSDGTEIPGETNRSFIAQKSGKYYVRVRLEMGCIVLSDTIQVTVNPNPDTPIVSNNRLPTLCPGDIITLSSSASAGNQWYMNSVAIPGAMEQSFQTGEPGSYRVAVTNEFQCRSESPEYIIATAAAPVKPLVSAAGPLSICAGTSVTLTSNANEGSQWLLDGTAINGATGNSLVAEKSGTYSIRVTNAAGCSEISDAVSIVLHEVPEIPKISASGSTQLCAGNKITLASSAATGNQWLKNGIDIPGANGQSLEISETGGYSVRVSNASGCAATAAVTTVTVNPTPATPSINAGGPLTFCAGNNVVLTSDAASGNQWLKDGVAIGNSTGRTLQVTASGAYTVQVTNANGCVSAPSAVMAVTVNANPAKPPIDWNGTEFSTLAGFPGYKWYKDGIEIPGAASNVFKPVSAGNYKTSIIDVNACTTSSDAYPLVITGVDDIRIAGASIVCFPNPAREAIFIQVDQVNAVKIQARLFDIQGRIMTEKILTGGRNFVPTGQLPAGLYFLQLSHGKEKTITRILVTK